MADAQVVFTPPESLHDTLMHYCSGCTHGTLHRVVAEIIDELGLRESTVGICPVGCAVYAYNYFAVDMIEAAHGRAPAVATGVKRSRPDCTVFTYQGDGDLASIGMGEIVHAAARNEAITAVREQRRVGMTQDRWPHHTVGQRVRRFFGRRPTMRLPGPVVELLNALRGRFTARASGLPELDAKRKLRNAFLARRSTRLASSNYHPARRGGKTPRCAGVESTTMAYYPSRFRPLPSSEPEESDQQCTWRSSSAASVGRAHSWRQLMWRRRTASG